MEVTIDDQLGLMETMNKLCINYKKTRVELRTTQLIKSKLCQLDTYWQEFTRNHEQFDESDIKTINHPYFKENLYEQTRTFYNETRELLLRHLAQAEQGLPSTSAQVPIQLPTIKTSASNEEELSQHRTPRKLVSQLQHSDAWSEQSTTHQRNNQEVTEPSQIRYEPVPVISKLIEKPNVDQNKLEDMLRKQQSNIKAFARTIYNIDLEIMNEKWEFEDALRSLQSRSTAIDSLHWEIDSQLNEDDESYLQVFYKYEKKFEVIKKQINTKMWSVSHRERSTPKIDIPTFSGNFHQWISFKDLFNEAVHSNRSMSNAQKMQFLKNKVRGEAEKLIQHLNISTENYEACWTILNHRYNNLKLIFSSYVTNLVSLPNMQHQNYAQIKKLHDTINESLNGIKNLGVETSTWGPLVVEILSRKLDGETYTEYVESVKNPRDLPTLNEFLEFLEIKFTSFESSRRKVEATKPSTINHQEHQKKAFYRSYGVKGSSNKEQNQQSSYYQRNNSPVCNMNHGIFRCETFLGLTNEGKRKIIGKLSLCKNCLYNHHDKDCISEKTCRTCNGKHNTLVHDVYSTSMKSENSNEIINKKKQNYSSNVAQETHLMEILLATAIINVRSADGTYHPMRALVDQGSQISIMTENAAQTLCLPRQRCKGIVYGIGAKGNNCKGVVTANASSLHSDFNFDINLFVMKNLIHDLPNRTFCKPSWSYLDGVQLADPEFNISRPIDILLGADIYATIIQSGIIKESESLPIAQQTRLGWILCGNVTSYQCNIVINNIEDIQQFWNIEDIADKSTLSTEDQRCLQYYQDTTIRQKDGRYVVRLPLIPEKRLVLGASKSIAIAQFLNLERKLQKNKDIAEGYKSFINEYITLGHMRECDTYAKKSSNETLHCYLPHHCVLREDSSTTSLRVVFNASARTTTGLSLNDIMFSGPNLQQELLSLIIKWRQFKIAFTADVEKMFRQINLNVEDQSYQKIIWRDSPDQKLREYALTTVTYGTKSAPFLAMMTLRQLASDERHRYPEAARVVEESFYMDDLVHGCHSITSAKKLQADLINLLQQGGFNLRKWSSNKPELLEGVSKAQDLQPTFEFKHQESKNTLGLRWQPHDDQFSFQLTIESTDLATKITKRWLLSNISKIFDPLGWLSPVTTDLKLLFQKVISHQISWDDEVPGDIRSKWELISRDLHQIKHIKMPRWLGTLSDHVIELHGFCDASIKAYACVIYCRIPNQSETQSKPILVAAKSRLVPLNKTITLPRLELCAALLLSTLMSTVKQALSNYDIKVIGWSDSTAVLGWLQGDPSKWKPFVTNRVQKITNIIPPDCWKYVKSGENPADCASREIKANQLLHHPLWWNGPNWLSSYDQNVEKPIFTTNLEVKSSKGSFATTHQVENDVMGDVINKYSSFNRVTRIVAWILRIALRNKHDTSYLTTNELCRARNKIIKYVQETEFSDEINNLKNNQPVSSKSRILNLNPFLDQDGILRVGGRIKEAHINWERKHPAIIPHDGHLTDLIIDQSHKSTLHGGARLTLAQSRQKYWIIGGNRAIKKRLRLCVTCRKQKPSNMTQLMGDLPEPRLNPSRPFYHTGVDYTGFVHVKANKGRGIKTTKGYVAVFVCMATKAVHLELVSDLTSESFLAALRRMSARRGAPCHIYSDNGTNFVGASKLIKKEFDEIKSTLNESFFNAISDMNINWHFNAPGNPSAGGLWEICVKSLKYHLCRVLGDQHLTFEEFSTLLAQIEAALNARPLCAISEDPEDLDYLTPSHFLSSGPTLHILDTDKDERTRWRLTQRIFNDLWKRWQSEYLSQLQSRCKWKQVKSNIKVGDIVTINDANLPAGKWALGRVLEVHPGKDGYVRVVSIKTKNGVIKRPIIKISVLPVSEKLEPTITNQNQSKTRNPERHRENRKPKLSFITMALMLFMLIVSPVEGDYNISYFKTDQGMYFDKISNMRVSRDEWKLVVYYNIQPYWQGSQLFTKYINHLEDTCLKIAEQSHNCKVVLLQLRHGFAELDHYNNMLLGQRTTDSRKRRGLINGIGNIAHSLFGVLDEQFAEQYQNDIRLIRSNQKHMANLWKNQTSVIEAESNLLQRVEKAMETQHKIFNQHLNSLESSNNQIKKELEQSRLMNEFTVSSIIANSILVNLKSIQDTLLETITNILYGKFNIHLLTPEQLVHELNIIAGQISSDLSLPYDNINTDLPKLYHIMKVKTRMTKQFLLFEIKIPLVSRDNYELYRLIAIPKERHNQMIALKPISYYVAINIQKESFISIAEENMNSCESFDTLSLICQPQYHFSQSRPSSKVNIKADFLKFEMPPINNIINLSVPEVNQSIESRLVQLNIDKDFKEIRQKIDQMKKETPISDQISYHDIHHYVGIYITVAIMLVIVAVFVRRHIRHRRERVAQLGPRAPAPAPWSLHLPGCQTPCNHTSPPLPPPPKPARVQPPPCTSTSPPQSMGSEDTEDQYQRVIRAAPRNKSTASAQFKGFTSTNH